MDINSTMLYTWYQGCTWHLLYYHARVLHDRPWRAADSTVYKSSRFITTISPGDMMHQIRVHIYNMHYNNLFSWVGLATRGVHNSSSNIRTSRAEAPTAASSNAAAAEVATEFAVRIATPTPDLGQLRRLPRQAVHRVGTSPRTIKTRSL